MSKKIALTPSAVNKYLKEILEGDVHLKSFNIRGEISNLKYHSNGNMYFSIKDEDAGINCIMFSSYKNKLQEKFNEGDKIELFGSLYLYIKNGQYNINVFSMEKIGKGNLFEEYEKLKKKLAAEGLFDTNKKVSIPTYPEKICVITSKTGAAIQDIISTIKRRYPICQINLIPTLVQGKNGATMISNNIKLANDQNLGDVIIVGRGGGSIEDLWNFNEEIVVRAVYESKIPIISSVGHETDFTLCDFVADVRAPTPTAAAELATPDIIELKKNLKNYEDVLKHFLSSKLNNKKLELKIIEENQYFKNPLIRFNMEFDIMNNNFKNSLELKSNDIKFETNKLNHQLEVLNTSMLKKIEENNILLNSKKNVLDELNPLTILSKGYSISKVKNKILKNVDDVNINEEVVVNLKDGKVTTIVIAKEKYEKI